MDRGKFLEELRIALQGKIPQAQVNEQLRYYETYIIEESRKGRTEEQVLGSLGDPRLIAKTIIGISGGGTIQGEGAESRAAGPESSRLRTWIGRLLRGILLAVSLFLLVRIGLFLLPALLVFLMFGALCYVAYFLFFGGRR